MGRKNKKKTGEQEGTEQPAQQEIPSPTTVPAGNIPVIPQDQPGPSGAGDVQSVTEEVQELSVEGSETPVGQGKKGRSRRRKGGSTLPQDQQQALSQVPEQIVSQDPQQTMPQGQPQWRPQTPQQTIFQGPPQAMPQGQPQPAPQGPPQTMPQGQPQWRPQGLSQTMPQGQPQWRPQGPSQIMPQGQPQWAPQGPSPMSRGQPQWRPQGPPQMMPQGPPQMMPHGLPQTVPQGPPQMMPQGLPQTVPQGPPQMMPQGLPQTVPQGPPQVMPQGLPQTVPQGLPQTVPQGQLQGRPHGQQQAQRQGRPQGQQQGRPPQGQQQAALQRPVQSVQSNVVSGELQVPKRDVNMSGPKTGRKIQIEVNYFPLNIAPKAQGYHYDVTIEPDVKKLKFKIMQQFFEQYFPGRHPVFDGMKNMYSCGALSNMPSGELSGQVEYNEPNRAKPCTFKVRIKKVANVDFQSLSTYMRTGSSNNAPQAAIQCVDVVLRYGALCHYVKVGRSVFSPPTGHVVPLGGGLEMWHGSFQSATLKWKPLLNFDIAHKGFPKQQNVVDLIEELLRFDKNNKRDELRSNEIADLKKFIRTLRVEFQIPGQSASRRTYAVNDVVDTPGRIRFNVDGRNMTVLDYFNNVKRYTVKYPNLPCLWVGSKTSEIKICYPVELCTIVGGQAVLRKLDGRQTSEMIKQSTVKADERKRKIMDAFKAMEFSRDGALKEFGLSVGTQFEKVQGRVIPPPVLQYSGESKVSPKEGQWRGGRFKSGAELMTWVVLSVCRVDARAVNGMVDLLINVGRRSGMNISRPEVLMRDTRALQEEIMKAAQNKIQLVMVIFDDYREDPYSKIKQFAELNYGVLTQCIKKVTVERKMNDATASQLLLKINSKLDQTNHSLDIKPKCLKRPCMIMGADVTHPPPGLKQGEEPSIAAVAASHCPVAFKYNITLRLQPSKAEMIDDLRSMVKEQLLFFSKQTRYKPAHLIMFRDGVSEGQFEQVLNIELTAIRAACTDLEPDYKPAITYLVVQKRHHTRFFPTDPRDGDRNMNVPVGTCIDTDITHPTEFDFYLLSHASIRGMARPTRYHKLWDDAGMTDTEIEELAFHLCHMYTRCNRSVSYPAPTYYAHLAAARAKVLTENRPINMNNLQAEQDRIKVVDTILKQRPMFFV